MTFSIHTQGVDVETTLLAGAKLKLSAEVTPSISCFKLDRLIGLRVSWVQTFMAKATASLTLNRTVEMTRSGRVLQTCVPGWGFNTPHIPFVGRASASAFIRIDSLLELSASIKCTTAASCRGEMKHMVSVGLLPLSISMDSISPLNQNAASSGFSFHAAAEACMNGFAGVRPSLGFDISLGRRNAGGNAGAKVGVELDTTVRIAPLASGACNRALKMEGALNILIKDLTLELEQDREVKKEITLREDLSGVRVGTLFDIPKSK